VRVSAQPYTQLAEQSRRNELIESHLGLVRHILGKLIAQLPPGVDVENLESAATLGLVEAANKFDPERGIKFETYAYTRIRGAVLDELRRNCPLPQRMLERVALVRRAYEGLPPGSGTAALAAASGLSEDELADCLAAMRLARMSSWEAEPPDCRFTDRAEAPDDQAQRAEQKELLADAIQALGERERLVVTLYYMEDLRLKEIGALLKLSESRVSRVLNAGLYHLGEYMRARQGEL
jgi:RNA polymerase sigma factor for flagellar operon FliA